MSQVTVAITIIFIITIIILRLVGFVKKYCVFVKWKYGRPQTEESFFSTVRWLGKAINPGSPLAAFFAALENHLQPPLTSGAAGAPPSNHIIDEYEKTAPSKHSLPDGNFLGTVII